MKKIAIIGLGYVGLPLAVEFSKKHYVIGYDINSSRIKELKNGIDKTNEISSNELESCNNSDKFFLTSSISDLKDYNIYIITVPTPINDDKTPNLNYLLSASKDIGKILKKNDIVIFESTVYPGCTEEVCIPELERTSNLIFNKDFYCGYSPERINPGDKINTLSKIKKVTSGSNENVALEIDKLYKSIIIAGTHLAPSIKVAEASKAIENAQRDLNISFVNELALIFDKIGIDTKDVLEAAGTKWNFLKFKPGLVGGHCISVDPYYLVHKAESLGYHPNVILSGRRVNDYMPKFIVQKLIKLMINRDLKIKSSNVLILGLSFKENCPDIRNSKVFEVYKELLTFNLNVDVYDPLVERDIVLKEFKIDLISDYKLKKYGAVILAVSHDEFKKIDFKDFKKNNSIIFDLKSVLDKDSVDLRL
ncbi:nucleotide sugar dehydrogenase [Flavobacteriaceae bacterium]|nr:nucleotide sugar dehydrogenase [Flavobacteriaceae bacterium]